MTKYTKEELEELIITQELSYEAIGRMYNVTGAAIKKTAKKLGIELPQKRSINQCEDFKKTNIARSKVEKLSNEEFTKIIQTQIGWKNISIAMGYGTTVNSNIKEQILERCQKLNIKPQIQKVSPTSLKTKQELLSARKNYQSYRSSIRKLAEKTYNDSGKPLKCAICGYDKHVEIAHIKAVSDFKESALISEINNIDNLIALCPNHHWEYDNGLLTL